MPLTWRPQAMDENGVKFAGDAAFGWQRKHPAFRRSSLAARAAHCSERHLLEVGIPAEVSPSHL
ncbi:hypothetical protein ACP_3501 [Acidobacterium capsulatum ATCC 51196]|uniref:Uncharacterized protein n=1 Tax=Acidobacterium capsulatum (strain ATCC 51196 / DSM 11244 / BCRC 80197 / JCM 7670 / NBRC 15755 / NCIMB 13165 / 161) TaxID=240015 RepID=C1F731_ACIC5|nr:hypothetical protein ACP_3501 [Acidobacterium capsulatum ATCC 51196]